jgi:hypothetical protein
VEIEARKGIPGELGEPIGALIDQMLIVDPATRPSASDLLSRWQELFLEAASRHRALEGRVI